MAYFLNVLKGTAFIGVLRNDSSQVQLKLTNIFQRNSIAGGSMNKLHVSIEIRKNTAWSKFVLKILNLSLVLFF